MDKKDFRIITTTNENDTYLPFWPTMAQHWKNFCGFGNVTLGFITERDETDPLVEEMRQYGEVILIKPIEKNRYRDRDWETHKNSSSVVP